jgi:hypothetical protein
VGRLAPFHRNESTNYDRLKQNLSILAEGESSFPLLWLVSYNRRIPCWYGGCHRSILSRESFAVVMMSLMFGAVTLMTAGAGIITGVDGISKIDEANKIELDARMRYDRQLKSVEILVRATQELIREYSSLQVRAHFQSVDRFITLVDRIDRALVPNVSQLLAGVERVSLQQIQHDRFLLADAQPVATTSLELARSGANRSDNRFALMRFLGRNGAETRRESAIALKTLGWLGGGTFVLAGGATLAFGSVLVGGALVAPVLAIGGFTCARQGHRSLARSDRYEETIKAEIAKLNACEDFMGHVQRRVIELKQLVTNLNARSIAGLTELEGRDFTNADDVAKLERLARSIQTLAAVMQTPIVPANIDRTDPAAKPEQRNFAPLNAKYYLFKQPTLDKTGLLAAR